MKKDAKIISAKPKLSWKQIGKMFHEAFVAPFKVDKRVRMSYSERMGFINQVSELERQAIRNV